MLSTISIVSNNNYLYFSFLELILSCLFSEDTSQSSKKVIRDAAVEAGRLGKR